MILEPKSILHSRYQIENMLGSGGTGAVYRAFDTLHDKPCAVKEFYLSNLPQEPGPQQGPAIDSPAGQPRPSPITRMKAIDLFKREAKVLATLNHPNLPKVTDYFGLGEDYYLVMTLVEGKDLHKLMEERQWQPVPEKTVLVWARQVMDALGYCHGLNLIHRDVKPSNIITCDPEMIYLVDFGVAKFMEPGKSTGSTAQVLTPRYSPPEQYTGQGVMDARVDIYSLGATLYTVLTGQQPIDAVSRLTGTKLPALRQINPSISPYVEAVIIKALSLEQDKRFINMQEMADALEKGPEKELEPPLPPSRKKEDESTIIYNLQQKKKSPPEVAPAQPQTSCSASLQILGIERPYSFSLKKGVTKLGRLSEQLGSDIDIDLTPFDLRRIISRHHASVEFSAGYYFLADDNSHNGTWLNGRKLSPGERNQLADGDTIKFGSLQPHGVQGVVRISR
jgi:serine/threonine-protein kinase